MKRMACLALAAALAAGLMPQAALAQDTPQVGPAQTLQISDGAQGGASTGVYIDVLSDFRLIEMTSPFVAEGTEDALAITAGRLFATLDGGSGVASATWKVLDAAGDTIGVFDAVSEQGGKWVLPLSAGAQQDALDITAPCEYTCIFTATDRSNVTVSGTVAFQVLAEGQTSDYAPKTIYRDHEQTFDGVATFAEPSASGLIHDYVQHLTSTELAPGSPAYEKLAELAAAHAAEQEGAGAYTFIAAWSLAALFTHEIAGEPVPYKGELSVVIPLPSDGPAPGALVTVFGYTADGAIEPFEAVVQQNDDGQRFVRFGTSVLGAFAVASYSTAPGATVRVIATAEGPGTINYEGTYTWPRADVKRYLFLPELDSRIISVALEIDGAHREVPASVLQLGYLDLDLASLSEDAAEVRIHAVFGPAQQNPDEEKFTFRANVASGTGSIAVNGSPAENSVFRFGPSDEIVLEFTPTAPSQSVKSALLYVEGIDEPLPLQVSGNRAILHGVTANSRVEVEFSNDIPQPALKHTVSVSVVGGAAGHGSVDVPYEQGPRVHVERTVEDGAPVSFVLHPQEGYSVYAVTDGDVEISKYLDHSESGLTLTLPAIFRSHDIRVEYRKTADKPPVIPADKYVTIEVASEVEAGSTSAAPAIVTPPSAIVPKGGGYTFSVIPGNAQSTLSRVLVKGTGELAWRDITEQVFNAWVEWPQVPEGATSTGYYDLALAGVQEDTFVRVFFRDFKEGDPERPPTPTRSLRINVKGEGGTVSPNTVGKEPLRVPVGKAVQVTIIRADGAYVSSVVSSGKAQQASPGDTIDLTGSGNGVNGTTGVAGKDVLDGSDTFEIPDSTADEEYTFEFAFGGSNDPGPGPDDPDDPNKPDNPDTPDTPTKPGDPSGPQDPAGPTTPNKTYTVTPVVVPGADGKLHGSISPDYVVSVPEGDSFQFTFSCDPGYRVGSVEVNGERVATGHVDGYLLQSIYRDSELRVTFVPRTEEDAITPVKRPIHRLQSLAQTGDHLPVLIFSLAALGCAALGVLVLVSRRPKRKEEEDE